MIVGYVLCNVFGETLTIPRELERAVAQELHDQGWRVYRQIVAA